MQFPRQPWVRDKSEHCLGLQCGTLQQEEHQGLSEVELVCSKRLPL